MKEKRQSKTQKNTLFDAPPLAYADTSKGNALTGIFPGWEMVDQRESLMVGLPATGAAYFAAGRVGVTVENQKAEQSAFGGARGGDFVPLKHVLPQDRAARYAILRQMAKDPTIDSALKMHISNALSAKSDDTDAVYINSVDGTDNKIVEELRAVLMPIIDRDLNEWARKAAVYGSCFARVYGEPGQGITNVRCEYHTHPRFIQKFEKGGRLAGYTSTYQGANSHGRQVQLLPPWFFVGFEIPEWEDFENLEPVTVTGIPVDLSVDDYAVEGLVESQEYGTSLIATAFGPWLDLLEAIMSLKMSRRNAARLERLVGVSTGKLDPERAARYLDMIAERVTNASDEVQQQSYLSGTVQTVVNHLFPIYGDHGGVQVDAVQGTPDINGLEDVLFHIKRLGGALGVDPSLLGFGDLLSGGLGDGGFFRMSVLAGTKANMLRKAIASGIERLCEIHVAYKYGKIFTPEERPWAIKFNSISSAIEREEQNTLEAKIGVVQGIISSFATLDQEFAIIDKREFAHTIWTMMRLDDEVFEKVFPEKKAKEAEKAANDTAQDSTSQHVPESDAFGDEAEKEG
ncbi:MAG: hypothetical protein IJU76_14140 [Desulfovibrionaceae bacterium]|nr:hypothetical protein [Desulfovibrionaceae bacterium]